MAQTKINGATQIQAGTIPLTALVSGYSVPTGNLTDGASFIRSGGTVSMAANLNLGGFKATNSAAPTGASDLVTKSYVDALINGFTIYGAKVVAVANSALSGLLTIDGHTLLATEVVLLTAQTTGSQNGPWVAASGSWTRPTWWAAASVVTEGNYFIIDPDGTTYKNTKWFVTTVGNITVDTTSITLVQDLSGTAYTNGTGLSLTGNVFAVLYGTSSTTAAVGNDSRITGALQTSALGTGVATALAANGSAAGGFPILDGSGNLAAADFPILAGDVTTAGGSLTTTINHTSGSGFLKYTDFIWGETPSGTINGTNATFTLANTPANTSTALQLFLNGIRQRPGSGNDFTISGLTITMLNVPQTGDGLLADYAK